MQQAGCGDRHCAAVAVATINAANKPEFLDVTFCVDQNSSKDWIGRWFIFRYNTYMRVTFYEPKSHHWQRDQPVLHLCCFTCASSPAGNLNRVDACSPVTSLLWTNISNKLITHSKSYLPRGFDWICLTRFSYRLHPDFKYRCKNFPGRSLLLIRSQVLSPLPWTDGGRGFESVPGKEAAPLHRKILNADVIGIFKGMLDGDLKRNSRSWVGDRLAGSGFVGLICLADFFIIVIIIFVCVFTRLHK